MRKNAGKYVVMCLMYLVMAFVVIISVFPLIWVLISSFKTNAQILNEPFALPESISFQAYAEVLESYDMIQYALNSLMIASVATIISLIIFSMGAYVIARYDFPGKNLLYVLFTITMLVPVIRRRSRSFHWSQDCICMTQRRRWCSSIFPPEWRCPSLC